MRRRRKLKVIVRGAFMIFCVANVFFSLASGLIVATLWRLTWRPVNFRQGANVSFFFCIFSTFYSLRPRGCFLQNLVPIRHCVPFFVSFLFTSTKPDCCLFLCGKICILFYVHTSVDGFAGISRLSFHFDLHCSALSCF